MKIAIASVNKDEKSEISQRAGRAPYFLIFEDGKLIEIWNNVFGSGGGGAGFSVGKVLADKSVNKVIAGQFGPNMTSALEKYKIAYQEAKGKVLDYIN